MPLDSQFADLMLCLWVLHISNEIPPILKECRRIARPGATLLIAVPDIGSQLYHAVADLTARLFPKARISDPDTLLREQHDLIFAGLAGSEYSVTQFSGTVSLPPEPVSRILPLIDFVQWLLPHAPTLREVHQIAFTHKEQFAAVPAELEDKGLLIKAVF